MFVQILLGRAGEQRLLREEVEEAKEEGEKEGRGGGQFQEDELKGGEFKDDEGQVDNSDDNMGGHERCHVNKALPLD